MIVSPRLVEPSPLCKPERLLVHELIERHALRSPGRTAVIDDTKEITYQELNARAAALAGELAGRGVGPELLVALILPRDVDLLVAILAVLKAGAAFVPFELTWPEMRIHQLIGQMAPWSIVTTARLRDTFNLPSNVLLLDDHCKFSTAALPRVSPMNLAYVLSTSGSTGTPKAVGIEHKNLSNYVDSITAFLDLTEGTSFALLNSVAADLGYTSLFTSLCTGSTLQVVPARVVASPEALAERLDRNRPDFIKTTPSLAAAFASSRYARSLMPQKCLILGGEVLRKDVVARILGVAPGLRIVNHYGPTETTVGVLVNPNANTPASAAATVPVGRPLPGTAIRILNSNLIPVTEGHPGELYISGRNVSRGYINDPKRTAERFIPDPASAMPGDRMYQTGDSVRQLDDGDVEFLARSDAQVKICGFRVETGEIEAVLSTSTLVKRVAVELSGEGDQAHLVAYVEPCSESACDVSVLQQWVRERLPDHMVPARFMVIADMPCLSSGKIDRKTLRTVGATAVPVRLSDSLQPTLPVEVRVASLWQEILGIETIAKSENFFDAGGNSLTLIRLQTALETKFGRTIPIGQLFAHPTIAGMAADLAAKDPSSSESVSISRVDARRTKIAAVRQRRILPRD